MRGMGGVSVDGPARLRRIDSERRIRHVHPHCRPRPSVQEALSLLRELYASPGGGVGCCLHVVVQNGNVEDAFVEACAQQAAERNHPRCVELAAVLARMTKTQREKLRMLA